MINYDTYKHCQKQILFFIIMCIYNKQKQFFKNVFCFFKEIYKVYIKQCISNYTMESTAINLSSIIVISI